MISSELAPYAKTGGLGDVTAALASRLQRHGHDLRVFLPLYSDIDRGQISLTAVETLQDIELTTSGSGLRYSVFTGSQADGLVIHFIDCPMLYERPGIYTEDDDEHLRFNTLSRCAIEYCQHLAWAPEIVHCNDWQSSLVPLYLKTLYAWDRLFANTRSVLSIHNIGYQGVFNAEIIDTTGLGGHREMFDQHDLAKGRLNFLKTGVLYADALTTVSPTYAQEICTAEYGMGLEDLLKHRCGDLHGILNGVDYDIWNPECDTLISHTYSASDMTGKTRNKNDLQRQYGLAEDPDIPLIGIVSRLVTHKGFALFAEVLPQLLSEKRLQLVVLGSGEERYEDFFGWLANKHPTAAGFWRGFNDPLAHLIEAGSDFFLMPSLYEPCGLNQMYSLRYGTIPIVRKTGGLADTVIPHTEVDGTGIVFEHPNESGLSWALHAGLELYADRPRRQTMIANGMKQNFSWEQQTRLYERLFCSLIN